MRFTTDYFLSRLEEMEDEIGRQSSKQRAKVLHDLWMMDDHGVRPTKASTKTAADLVSTLENFLYSLLTEGQKEGKLLKLV